MRKLAITALLVLAMLALAACGGDAPSPSEDRDPAGNGRNGSPAAEPTATSTVPPTPERQDEEIARTQAQAQGAGEPTMEQAGNADAVETATPVPVESQVAEPMETPEPAGIASLVPENPQFTDEALLQDIYAVIQLDQFELDPEAPIDYPKERIEDSRRDREHGRINSTMEYPMVHDHPYLHLFPSLAEHIEVQEEAGDFEYDPGQPLIDENRRQIHSFTGPWRKDISAARNGIIYFIYHPWFEPVYFHTGGRVAEATKVTYSSRSRRRDDGWETRSPHWFGENSTRGILAKTVASLLEQAQVPGVKTREIYWWKEETRFDYIRSTPSGPSFYEDAGNLELQEWSIEKFITNTVTVTDDGHSNITENVRMEKEIKKHQTPQVEWEILSPHLPVIKVTAHASQRLPIDPPEGNGDGLTDYSVSFVMSLQNRWDSFEDERRWIIRFREDLAEFYSHDRHPTLPEDTPTQGIPPWGPDPELEARYPNYWDDTDYMQHRIIGPVVMTVHQSPVLEPGNYSATPSINEWAAPGHVLTDQQVPVAKRETVNSSPSLVQNPDDPAFRQWPMYNDPNAGFPLPGHVMTTPETGPGTEVWKAKGMDDNDW